MATALQVATRLWLGGVVSPQRNRVLIEGLVGQIRTCAFPRPLLICGDGLATYVKAIRRAFRDPLSRQGQTGRCQLQRWRRVHCTSDQAVRRAAGGWRCASGLCRAGGRRCSA
jgi:hypothetical protein